MTNKNICKCGHNIDFHIEQFEGRVIAGECSICPCKKFIPQNKSQEKNSQGSRPQSIQGYRNPETPDTQTPLQKRERILRNLKDSVKRYEKFDKTSEKTQNNFPNIRDKLKSLKPQTPPTRKNKDWSNVEMSLGTDICMDCKRETFNILNISRFKICGDCLYRRAFG